MSRELYIAFCFSVAVHAAVVGVCPSPQAEAAGQEGDKQDIVVLGVISLSAPIPPEVSVAEPLPGKKEVIEEKIIEPDPLPSDELTLVTQEPQEDESPEPPSQPKESAPEIPVIDREMASGRQQLTRGQLQDIRSQYLREVMRKLEEAKRYPPQAYRRGLEGTAEVVFTISHEGNVDVALIRKSSGYNSLDTAARDMVTRASPFDPIPEELELSTVEILAPVAFRIEEAETR